jgi:hypothetical protein
MIIKIKVLLLVFFISACSSAQHKLDKSERAYLLVNNGVDVIPAVVSNPFPDCKDIVNVARLDSQPELQIYIDINNDGSICK